MPAPPRELAKQTFKVMTHFCSHAGLLPPLLLVGGTDVEDNFKRFTEEGKAGGLWKLNRPAGSRDHRILTGLCAD